MDNGPTIKVELPGHVIRWLAPGPVAQDFFNSMPRSTGGGAGFVGCVGPVGSGKTRTAFAKIMAIGMAQPPSPVDRLRRYSCGVARSTYRMLWSSTIPSLEEWIPPAAAGVEKIGTRDGPVTFQFYLGPFSDGSHAELTMPFVGFGDADPDLIMAGRQVSSWFIDEVNLFEPRGLIKGIQRCGRFPSREPHGEAHWYGMIGVCNAFSPYHPLYPLIRNPAPGMRWFVQPGARDPGAENLRHLATGYYDGQIEFMQSMGQEDEIARVIDNRFVINALHGQGVHARYFDERTHLALGCKADPSRKLIVGGDAGRHPAAVFLQRTSLGQWRVLRELYRPNMDAYEFGEEVNRVVRDAFPDLRMGAIEAWGDPASANSTETSTQSWLAIMSKVTGFTWRPAPNPNNDVSLRLAVVNAALRDSVGGGVPGLLIDRSCSMLITGMAGAYHYPRIKGAGGERISPTPSKNEYSHLQDALQNGLLGGGEYADVAARRTGRQAAFVKPVVAKSNFGVWG